MLMDRNAITVMLEEHWRNFIHLAYNGHKTKAAALLPKFEKKIEEIADLLPLNERTEFLGMVEEERERLFNEYNTNPSAMKARIGIPDGAVRPTVRASRRTDLGGVAVRSAVRATVWELVVSLFRALRR